MKDQHLESSIFGDSPDAGATSGGTGPDGSAAPSGSSTPGAGAHPGDPGDPARPADAAPGGARLRRRRRQHRRSRRLIVLLVTLALVAGAGVLAVQVLKPMVAGLTASNDWTGTGTGRATVVVHAGDAGRTIGVALQKAGVVKTSKAFADVAADNPQAGSIQPGSYALRTRMSAASALDMLLDPANRTVPRVTVREGLWKNEVIKALSEGTGRPLAEYQTALKNPTALGLPASARGNVEGYLFPATYEFDADAGATVQLRTMVAKTVAQLRAARVAPADARRVLTVASIVEAEAQRDADRGKVARVVGNRLARKMKLQMDSTVHYVVQRRGSVGTSDAERATRSPYNTYYAAGLAARPDRQPRTRLHRRSGQAHARSLAVLRRGQPGHRRDPVRRRRRRAPRQREAVQHLVCRPQGPVLSAVTPAGGGARAPQVHRAAVLGSPIAHSLSPALHRAAYAALGLRDWTYTAQEVREDELAGFVGGLGPEWAGLSLTMPLKEAAFAVAGEVSPLARQVGAVNTLVRSAGGAWAAHNTDVDGMTRALQEGGAAAALASSGHALVLGSGATARSAVASLASLGASAITFAVRSAARPETVAQAREAGLDARECGLGEVPAILADVSLVVSHAAGRRRAGRRARRRRGPVRPGAARRRLRRVADTAGTGVRTVGRSGRGGLRDAAAPGGAAGGADDRAPRAGGRDAGRGAGRHG